jgi:hypothetical protein
MQDRHNSYVIVHACTLSSDQHVVETGAVCDD